MCIRDSTAPDLGRVLTHEKRQMSVFLDICLFCLSCIVIFLQLVAAAPEAQVVAQKSSQLNGVLAEAAPDGAESVLQFALPGSVCLVRGLSLIHI